MNLSRRGFLGTAGLITLAAPAVITRPGLLMRVRSFLFPPTVPMVTVEEYAEAYLAPAVNGLISPSIISREAILILHNNLVAAGKVNRQFDRHFDRSGRELQVRIASDFA